MANRKEHPDSRVLTIQDLAHEAKKYLPDIYQQFFGDGAGAMTTLSENVAAYSRYKLRPRVLLDVDNVDTSTHIFGTEVSLPIGVAPTAAHKMAHPDGECGTSRAAAKNNIPMGLATYSSTSLEDVIKEGSSNPYAQQISFFKDTEVTHQIIRRAENAGYKALFVSVDIQVLGNRLNEARNNFSFPGHLSFPNVQLDPNQKGLMESYGTDYDATLNWEKTIRWLRQHTKMEIWLKGIVTAADVQLAIKYGVDGVVISNHGGRQLDGVPATLDVLRECGPVAQGKIPIIVDGGIRSGSDVFKALALGASMCFLGRIPIWGLAYNGTAGVDLAIKIIAQDLRHTMMLMGCRTLKDINKSHLSVLQPDGVLSKL